MRSSPDRVVDPAVLFIFDQVAAQQQYVSVPTMMEQAGRMVLAVSILLKIL